METLKDIFVSCEIAQKLKEIGFDEPCIGYYEKDNPNVRLNDKTHGTIKHNSLLIYISAPTYEQVKKWFREKGFYCNIHKIECRDCNIHKIGSRYKTFLFRIDKDKGIYESDLCTTYEEAQEQLILKLIEIYENGKKDR